MTDPDVLRRAATHIRALAAASVDGPWFARHTTNDGWPIDAEPREAPDFNEDAGGTEFGTISLVGGTAAPRTDDGQVGRDPGHYESHHLLAEHDEDDLAPAQAQELLDSYRWAAAVGPHIAETLALLLENVANNHDETGAMPVVGAVDLAHLLLTQKRAS